MNAGRFDIGGNIVVVTGGAGQLGQNFAAALSEAGARVAVFDRAAGRVYFLPPADLQPGDLSVSVLETPLLHLNGAAHVEITGLTFETGRGTGVLVTGGEHVSLAGCTLLVGLIATWIARAALRRLP